MLRTTPDYLQQAIGYFGWLDAPLPVWTYWLFIAAFVGCSSCSRSTAPRRRSVLVLCDGARRRGARARARAGATASRRPGSSGRAATGSSSTSASPSSPRGCCRAATAGASPTCREHHLGRRLARSRAFGVLAFCARASCGTSSGSTRCPLGDMLTDAAVATAARLDDARRSLRARFGRLVALVGGSPASTARRDPDAVADRRRRREPEAASGSPPSTSWRSPTRLSRASRSPTTASSRSTPGAASGSTGASPSSSSAAGSAVDLRHPPTGRGRRRRTPRSTSSASGAARSPTPRGTRTTSSAVGFAAALFRYFVRHRGDVRPRARRGAPGAQRLRGAPRPARHAYGRRDRLARDLDRGASGARTPGALVGTIAFVLQSLGVHVGRIQTVNSGFTRDRLRRYRRRADPIVLGLVDLVGEATDAPRAPSQPPSVLFVGRHIADKRLDALPAAARRTRAQDLPDLEAVRRRQRPRDRTRPAAAGLRASATSCAFARQGRRRRARRAVRERSRAREPVGARGIRAGRRGGGGRRAPRASWSPATTTPRPSSSCDGENGFIAASSAASLGDAIVHVVRAAAHARVDAAPVRAARVGTASRALGRRPRSAALGR